MNWGARSRASQGYLPSRRTGATLTLLAVVLNLLANVLYAPTLKAQGFIHIEWVEVCTAHGVQTVAVQVPDDAGKTAGKGYCPHCPLTPPAQGLLGLAPVPSAPEILALPAGMFLPAWSGAEDSRVPDAASCLPVLSRAPPASA